LSTEIDQAEFRQSVKSAGSEIAESIVTNSDFELAEVPARDASLVQRCICGEVPAWDEIYHKCHDPLCTAIRVRLGRLANDPHLVDEMAARTWYAVLKNDGARLRKYDPRRGAGILTFLKLIAYDEISRHFLSEQRRMKREIIGHSRKPGCGGGLDELITSSLSEFIITLSPREQDFCNEYLLLSADEDGARSDSSYSATNIRQLTHRIYKKFLGYIGRNK
jgi:hypothetical protein